VSQTDQPNGSASGRRMNPWDRFRRANQRKSKRRLFLEQLERRDLLAIAEFTALPDTYYLAAPNAETFLTAPQSGAPATLAIEYLRAHASSFGLTAGDLNHYQVTNNYRSELGGITHVYLGQTYNGLPIANAVASVSLTSDGRVLSAAASFVPGLAEPPANSGPTPYISAVDALRKVASAHGLPTAVMVTTSSPATGRNMRTVLRSAAMSTKDIVAELHYVPKNTGGVQLAWKVNVDMIEGFNWYDASVSAEYSPNGPVAQLVNVSDWVDNATYNVFPSPVESPLHGPRSIVTDPQDAVTSPFGWHDTDGVAGAEFTVTRGNNVSAQEDADDNDTGGVQPNGGAGLNFDFPLDATQAATTYTAAATVNLFYWNNIVHDVTARHGFDEASGNFQQTNYSGQGLGTDQVEADAQDGSGTNNANFGTPPDGQSGRMQMYIFDVTNPTRDGDLDSGIIVHEFGHGVSNRLTGGPANANALNALQSAGMGEGWSDWLALLLTQKPGDQATDARGIGMWVLGQPITGVGVRRFPYSFDMAVNPLTLGDFNGGFPNNESHNVGEIWCSALWDMTWLLINRHGYDPNLYTGGGGNNLALDLVLLGMKLQPANPTFCQARDAILAADAALTGSDNFDEIWTAFARRGFGLSADCGIDADATAVQEAFDKPVPPVNIGGVVFNDENGNGVRGPGELPLAGWTVYIDANNNAVRDQGERFQKSAADGSYLFNIFVSGSLTIREEVMPEWRQTAPGGDGAYRITVSPGQSITNLHFGNQELPGEIHGRKWNDLDGDGVMDPGEPGIQGVVIYVDLNNDAKIGIAEHAAVTDAFGIYTILNIRPGTGYVVREVYQPGLIQTFPDPQGTSLGAHTGVVVRRARITPNVNFGNKAAFDYGDAPAPYRTLISQNGPVHGLLQGFQLGALVDAETNGIPSVGANGDDVSNLDDEDGIVMGNLVRNSQQTLSVTASTGAYAAGYLQGWIDFNRDGDWNDAGERILTDEQLTTGTFTLDFSVPNVADNLLGPTYARFRYSLQHGIGPTGSALGGEVEDYLVNILGPNPTAIPDAFTVADNSFFFQNPLFVLANDLPSTSGPPGLFAGGLNTADTLGQVQLNDNFTPSDPTDDYYEYQPPANYVGLDSFRYSVRDPNGNQSAETTVTITVQFVARDPIALDDTFDVLVNSLAPVNKLDVMANDLRGTTGVIRFLTQTPPTAQHGVVTVDNAGTPANLSDDFYRYQPDPNFTGQDSFTYTIVDADNETSNGTVTVQVVPAPRTAPTDAIIKFELVLLHTDFTPVGPLEVLEVGDHILVQGRVTDIRLPGDPTRDANFVGAFSAYMDLLYDRVKFQPFGPIVFSTQYNTAVSGAGGTPGLIDEIGGTFSDQVNPPGPGAKLVFTKEFVASATGTNVQFVADPADVIPPHEITAFIVDPTPANSKVQIIPTDRVYFLASSPIAEIIGAGEGENTNFSIPVDVNQDGSVTPIDSLLVINYLNATGSDPSGSGEGESGNWKRDVNHDGNISPIDALLVINYLNRQQAVVPAGEGEGEADSDSPLSPAAFSFMGQASGDTATTDSSIDAGATAATIYAASVDAVFEQTDWTKTSVVRSEDAPYTSAESDSDEFFTSLEDGNSRRTRKGL
jgi:hypothetical protein